MARYLLTPLQILDQTKWKDFSKVFSVRAYSSNTENEFFQFIGSVALVRWPWFGGLGSVALVRWPWFCGSGSVALVRWLWFCGLGSVALVLWPWFGIVHLSSARNAVRRAMSRFTYTRRAISQESFHTVKHGGFELFRQSLRI